MTYMEAQLHNSNPLHINKHVRYLLFDPAEQITDPELKLELIVNGQSRVSSRHWMHYSSVEPYKQRIQSWMIFRDYGLAPEVTIKDGYGLYCFCLNINIPHSGSCEIQTLDLIWSDGKQREVAVIYVTERPPTPTQV